MKKYLFFSLLALVFLGCKEENTDSIISSGTSTTQEDIAKFNSIDKESYKEIADIFQDTAKITSQNKPYYLIFGANGCIYCDELKRVIANDEALKILIKENFSPYYINLSYTKTHKIDFLQKELSTQDLARMYNIRPTPTMVFLSAEGKELFIYPGFMPKEKLTKTLEFLKSKNIENLSQKEIAQKIQALI